MYLFYIPILSLGKRRQRQLTQFIVIISRKIMQRAINQSIDVLCLQAQSDDDDVGPDDVAVTVESRDGFMEEFFGEVLNKLIKPCIFPSTFVLTIVNLSLDYFHFITCQQAHRKKYGL